jgi:hypothetical protein
MEWKRSVGKKILGWTKIIIGIFGTYLLVGTIAVWLPIRLGLREVGHVDIVTVITGFFSLVFVFSPALLWDGIGDVKAEPWDRKINRIVKPILIYIPLLTVIWTVYNFFHLFC